MLRLSTFAIVVCAVSGLLACHRLSSTEKEVIGTWEWNSADAVGRTTFDHNHKVNEWFPELQEEETGTHGVWRLEGSDVVYSLDDKRFAGREAKIPLALFRENKQTTDRPYFVRVK